MRSCGIFIYESDILVDDSGYLSAQIQIKSQISTQNRVYNLPIGLPDTHFNRYVLGTLLILGIKQSFNNLKILSRTPEGLDALYDQADKIFNKLKTGSYGLSDRLPKKNGEKNFSAPQIVYYLLILKKPSPLTREDLMELNVDNFNISWLAEYKQNQNMLSYSLFKHKKKFAYEYEKEILNIRGILFTLKSRGKI